MNCIEIKIADIVRICYLIFHDLSSSRSQRIRFINKIPEGCKRYIDQSPLNTDRSTMPPGFILSRRRQRTKILKAMNEIMAIKLL